MLELNEIKTVVEKIAKTYSIKKVSLFGSYADGSADENSDVDMLVEFSTPNVSLLTMLNIKYDIQARLLKEVDLIHAPIESTALIKPIKVIDIYEQ